MNLYSEILPNRLQLLLGFIMWQYVVLFANCNSPWWYEQITARSLKLFETFLLSERHCNTLSMELKYILMFLFKFWYDHLIVTEPLFIFVSCLPIMFSISQYLGNFYAYLYPSFLMFWVVLFHILVLVKMLGFPLVTVQSIFCYTSHCGYSLPSFISMWALKEH